MIKAEDLISVEFSRSFLGYDMKEVDTLLDAVIEQVEAWEKERQEMLVALESLLQEIEQGAQQQTEPSEKRISAKEKAARIAQAKEHADASAAWERSIHAHHEGKRTKSQDAVKLSEKAQPLPQAVSVEAPEPMTDIPLAKMPVESQEEAFEIPTYVHVTESESKSTEPVSSVVEEIELPDFADGKETSTDPEHTVDTPMGTEEQPEQTENKA